MDKNAAQEEWGKEKRKKIEYLEQSFQICWDF